VLKKKKQSMASPLLRSEGWEACVDARLLRASEAWEEAPEFRAHGHSLRRLFTDLKIDAVLCIQGRPSVCIKDARTLSSAEVELLRRQLWNMGTATLFVAECLQDVKVFSTLVKPVSGDPNGGNAQLPNETIQNLQTVELALHLGRLVRRIETGTIYLEHKSLFDPQCAIDRALLENLREVRNLICPQRSRQGYQDAHALIGRFLFSCYLLDRRIIGPAYLNSVNLPEADDVLGLLQSATDAPKTLTQLFRVLQRDFNGSLFGNTIDDQDIGQEQIGYLQRFLSGEDLRTGQLSLFRLYDFAFIPVEFISSIYEDFLGAEAEAEAAERKSNSAGTSRAHSQRSQGAYYTPPRLAELAVDIATEGWTTLLDKRCFDPACGSGVFLVILFIRMAEEWRKRNPTADTRQRYDELMRLLSENLRGSDIHPTACLVTCFSLYLAFLDQMNPKEIIELRDALERDARTKLLPRILWEHNKPRPRFPHLVTVRGLDFFAMSAEGEFHLVIGNPPWVSRKPAPTAEKWLLSTGDNPHLKNIKTPNPELTLFPAHELACAFMWKAGLHLLPEGRVCQVLPSRVFLSNNTDRFQSAWLGSHRLETVWLLADWRFVLFPNADCPSFICRYHPRSEDEPLGDFEFVTPKVELLDPRQALITILPEDQKQLSELDIVSSATRRDAAAAWKKHHWGTPRDARLIERVALMPRLKRLARRPPSDPTMISPDRNRSWFKGQGFQPASDSTTDPKSVFWEKSDLFLGAESHVLELLLLQENCTEIGDLYRDEGLHRDRSPLLYKHPLLLINKACTKFLFSDFDVLFRDDFQSICAPPHEEDELLFLTAVLSSPLTQYLLFHTTANIGIERDIARLEEILELPFPLPEDTLDPRRSEKILRSCAQRLRKLHKDLQKQENLLRRDSLIQDARAELYKHVCDYFEICEWEQQLIKDTVEIFRPSSTPSSLESDTLFTARPSVPEHRSAYAETLVKTFRDWSSAKRHLCTSTSIAEEFGLSLITLSICDKAKPYIESFSDGRVGRALESIQKSSAKHGALFSRLRGFVLYEPDRVHILKPLNLRHWTRTAALNDADEILARMMEEDGWHD
jgi:Eco57I restriction-modification methylase